VLLAAFLVSVEHAQGCDELLIEVAKNPGAVVHSREIT
jgi:hypothetical protein